MPTNDLIETKSLAPNLSKTVATLLSDTNNAVQDFATDAMGASKDKGPLTGDETDMDDDEDDMDDESGDEAADGSDASKTEEA